MAQEENELTHILEVWKLITGHHEDSWDIPAHPVMSP